MAGWYLQSQLLLRIEEGSANDVEDLLRRGLDADTRLTAHKTPAVNLCVQYNHLTLVKLLLSWGCSINQCDVDGNTPLHVAAQLCNLELVSLLLKNRAHVNAVNQFGRTPLHLAACHASVDIIRTLVEAGAEINRRDAEGSTALLKACLHGNPNAAHYLIAHCGADVHLCDERNDCPLLFATNYCKGHSELLSALLEAGARPDHHNDSGESPLHAAVRNYVNNKDSLQLLLSSLSRSADCSLVDVNVRSALGQTPLHLATQSDSVSLIQDLVWAGSDINAEDNLGHTPIFYCIRDGNWEVAEFLLAVGARLPHCLYSDVFLADCRDPAVAIWLREKAVQCPTLYSLCRRSIWASVSYNRKKAITSLPLPRTIKQFLLFAS